MTYGDSLLIPAINNRMDGNNVLGDVNASMLIGGNLGGIYRWETNLPVNDVVKMSDPWVEYSGSATSYNIHHDQFITSMIGGDLVLMKRLVVDAAPNIPPGGTYTVRPWSGTAEISITTGGAPVTWYSSQEFTFEHVEGEDLYLFARGGTLGEGLAIILPGEVARYDSGNIWSQPFLDYLESMNPRILRPVVNHKDFSTSFNNRTKSTSLGWGGQTARNGSTEVFDSGTKTNFIPLEAQIDLCNRLNAHFHFVVPVYALSSYITSCAEMISENLSLHLEVHIEPGNEVWNTANAYFTPTNYIGTTGTPRREYTLAPGSNLWDAPSHAVAEGERIYPFLSPSSEYQPVWPSPLFSNQTALGSTFSPLRAINVTTDTFEVVLDDGSDAPVITPAGVDRIYAFRDVDKPGGQISVVDIDRGYGQRAESVFSTFITALGGTHTVRRLIGSQLDYVARTVERTGPNGCNGEFDLITLGFYYDSAASWAVGQTNAQMRDNDIARIDALKISAIDGHVAEGFPANTLCGYEGGQHWLTAYSSEGTEAQRNAAFEAYVYSAEGAEANQYWLETLAQADFRHMCFFRIDPGKPGIPGYWGSKRNIFDANPAKVTNIISYNGGVPRS